MSYKSQDYAEADRYKEIPLSKPNRRIKRCWPKPSTRSARQVSRHRLSKHAALRMAQRGLSLDDIEYILRYGQLYYAAAAIFYLLRNKDIPEYDHLKMSRLEGTAVIVAGESLTVITIWRNRKYGPRNIRHKLA